MEIFRLLFATLLVAITLAAENKCSTNYPPTRTPPGWALSTMSAAFLQIFRDQSLSCSGYITSWKFRSNTINRGAKPYLSVWEERTGVLNGDIREPLAFTLVGTNEIGDLTALGNDTYEFWVPELQRIQVDSSRKLYLGIFYLSIETANYTGLFYYDKLKPQERDPGYGRLPNSTVVGILSFVDIIRQTAMNDGNLYFDSGRMGYEMRIPFLQVTIEPKVQPTTTEELPPTIQTEPTTTLRTRPTTTATPTQVTTQPLVPEPEPEPEPEPGYYCGPPPSIVNAQLANTPLGYPGEELRYNCDQGYSWTYKEMPRYVCYYGEWVGDGYCALSVLSCYLPMSPGPCGSVSQKWYYDRTNKSCHWFWYGGCGGTANRFDTYDKCMQLCSVVGNSRAGVTMTPRQPPNAWSSYMQNGIPA